MKQRIHGGSENENHSLLCHQCGKFSQPRSSVRRGIRFLFGGLVGGTALVALMSFASADWLYLTRWLGGLAAVGIISVYILGKKWLLGRAVRFTQPQVETNPDTSQTEA